MTVNGSYSNDESPVFVNGFKNTTSSNSYHIRTGFSCNAGSRLVLNANASFNSTDISYSIQKNQNQDITNKSADAGVKWQIAKKTFFDGNFSFNAYQNSRLANNEDIKLLNASLRRILGKNNRFEIRLAAFDILNEQLHIQQSAYGNIVENSKTPTLARYYMLSLTYNLSGFDSKLNKGRFW